ncbi:isocitrate lyase/PEP mutase family protein [Ekhidna sp.]
MQKFLDLHKKEEPLILGNVWDVSSAIHYEKMNFNAVGTSSAAIAHTLGYEDGQNMPFDFYLQIVQRIISSIKIPLSVDLEFGYGNTPSEIIDNIIKLDKLGVQGINLEDSKIVNGERVLENVKIFQEKIAEISATLKERGINIFINLRSDAFLVTNASPLNESLNRIEAYKNYVDGIFLPGITEISDIESITTNCDLPLNVMCFPNLPDFETLARAGVKRISMGNFLHQRLMNQMEKITQTVLEQNSFS